LAQRAVPEISDKPSIAVLPFDNMSGDPEQEYFSDGITEDIITELSRFQSLFVIARNSSFAFKGQAIDIIDVAKKLGVQYVVEGSVRKASNRVRITAQLIEASTGNHLWAERYDRDLTDIFDVQDEVASQVATMVPGHIDRANRVQLARKPVVDMNVYDLTLRGENLLDWNVDFREAEKMLKKALEIDPKYARANSGLAYLYAYGIFTHGLKFDEAAKLARFYADTALNLNPGEPQLHASLADTYLMIGEHDLAGHHIEKAIALNPNDYLVMILAVEVKAYLGDYEAAMTWVDKIALCDPYAANAANEAYFDAHFLGGHYELALEQMVGWRDHPPHIYLGMAAAFAQLDRMEEAREAVLQFEKTWPEGQDEKGVMLAYVRMCARPEDGERWLEGFRKAGLNV
jgi:TolB-like protein/Flp pilus assembly protein TadD